MFGLLVMVIGAVYLVILVIATRAAYRWGGRKGLPKTKQILVAVGAFAIVYLPVFWDHVPTLVMYKYYCEKEAGLWVNETLEQWKIENPGAIWGRVANKRVGISRQGKKGGFTDTYVLSSRINKIVKEYRASSILPIYRLEREVVDTRNSEILARYTDFWTGYVDGWRDIKFWMTFNKRCKDDGSHPQHQFNEVTRQLVGESK